MKHQRFSPRDSTLRMRRKKPSRMSCRTVPGSRRTALKKAPQSLKKTLRPMRRTGSGKRPHFPAASFQRLAVHGINVNRQSQAHKLHNFAENERLGGKREPEQHIGDGGHGARRGRRSAPGLGGMGKGCLGRLRQGHGVLRCKREKGRTDKAIRPKQSATFTAWRMMPWERQICGVPVCCWDGL